MFETIPDIVEWAAVVVTLLGSLLNAFGKKVSFLIYIVGNILFISFSLFYDHKGLATLHIIFLAINILGWFRWKGNAPT